MLTLAEKRDIYGLILSNFQKGIDIPLASFALYLNAKKVDYRKFGYSKMKTFITDLDFIKLKSKSIHGHESQYVTILDFSPANKKAGNSMLSKEECKKIYSLLASTYKGEKAFPLSLVSQTLLDNGYNYKKLGYKKPRDFLTDISNKIELVDDLKNNNLNVIIHSGDKKDIKKEVKKDIKKKKDSVKAIEPKSIKGKAKTNEKVLPDITFEDTFFQDKDLLTLKDVIKTPLSLDSLAYMLLDDYKKAKEANLVEVNNDSYKFPLSALDRNNKELVGCFKKAPNNSPYKYFLYYLSKDECKPKDTLKTYIYFPDLDKSIQQLATLAKKERWCYLNSPDKYIILKIYLQYTFHNVKEQGKLAFEKESGFACFNTGLKTEDYEDIYGVMIKNTEKDIPQEFEFRGFAVSGSELLGKLIVEHFNPLPKTVTYFTNPSDRYYDGSCEIHTDSHHILIDNLSRFPISILKTYLMPFKEETAILQSIKKTKDEDTKSKLYSILENKIEKNTILYNLLKGLLEQTIERARRMAIYDYRTALPCYFPTRSVPSIMLPLVFDPSKGAEAVLLLEKTASGNYQGQTILTPKMAYVNARMVTPLEHSFLDPEKIND